MKRSRLIDKAHKALLDVDLTKVNPLINSVNLSLIEKEVIISSELYKLRISEIAEKTNLSTDSVQRIKTGGMKKIAIFLEINNR